MLFGSLVVTGVQTCALPIYVEITQKQFCKEEKNTDMNAIKHTTQPKIQTTF